MAQGAEVASDFDSVPAADQRELRYQRVRVRSEKELVVRHRTHPGVVADEERREIQLLRLLRQSSRKAKLCRVKTR